MGNTLLGSQDKSVKATVLSVGPTLIAESENFPLRAEEGDLVFLFRREGGQLKA